MKKQVILVFHPLIPFPIILLLVVSSPYYTSKINNKTANNVFANGDIQLSGESISKEIETIKYLNEQFLKI